MGTAKRLLANETLERLDSQSKFPAREGSLGAQTTRAQAFQILGNQVFLRSNRLLGQVLAAN